MGSRPVEKDLGMVLEKMTRAPLKPQQHLAIVKTYLLPGLYYRMVLRSIMANQLREKDRQVRKAAKLWLRLSHDVPDCYFYAAIRDARFGNPPAVRPRAVIDDHVLPLWLLNLVAKWPGRRMPLAGRRGNWHGRETRCAISVWCAIRRGLKIDAEYGPNSANILIAGPASCNPRERLPAASPHPYQRGTMRTTRGKRKTNRLCRPKDDSPCHPMLLEDP